MYHPSQQAPELTQLACLPLAKFSHTTTSIGHNGPLNWTHIIGNGDIVGRIESHTVSGSTPARVLLKVFRDYELLEEVDLTYHSQEAAKSALSGQSGQAKPVFAVIVKLPCLAVKYPKDNICIRRFQIKFSSDRDYYSTLVILSNIKCPFSESHVGSLPPARRPSQWRSGSVASAPAPPQMFPSVPDAPGIPTLNNMFLPSQSSPTIDLNPSARSSTTGPFQRPASSSTTHTLTDLVPTNNGQALVPSSTVPSSRPSTAFHDAQTLDEVLPPRRALPFAKPAAKKPRTAEKQTNNASRPSESGPEKTQTSIRDHYDSTPFKAINDTNNASRIKRSLTSFPQQSTNSEPANHPPSQQNTQASTNIPMPIPIQPVPPPRTLYQQGPSYDNTASRPHSHTNISRNTLPANIPSQSEQQQQCNALPMNVSPLPPQPQPQFQQQLQQQQSRQPDPIADLTSYISDSKAERIARLETWICSQIQNDDFISLAEDVEGLWQRFAFGKW
ncbi:uncharacterized protein ACHE_80557A [Aspergillus chevalieri]|uniref:Uncharacterized protein n=1 Tax=Aspergillus chevalieri TaxID=182096 RepID=A0A7R7ZTN3_ASPCH|nr:uncharacterized protein ACHE_80557A [Aspergillus chevalieri]BCR92657.1 hypothetical protein ACHE_80557A [Aspergillus chevalieri]